MIEKLLPSLCFCFLNFVWLFLLCVYFLVLAAFRLSDSGQAWSIWKCAKQRYLWKIAACSRTAVMLRKQIVLTVARLPSWGLRCCRPPSDCLSLEEASFPRRAANTRANRTGNAACQEIVFEALWRSILWNYLYSLPLHIYKISAVIWWEKLIDKKKNIDTKKQ